MAGTKHRGLGRGLEALIADTQLVTDGSDDAAQEAGVLLVDINGIKPNRHQPRKQFDQEKLRELADSILEHGVIQPLIIRKSDAGYELVAGERRWRAARLAGLKEVPCLVRDLTDEENALIAIIENMQREDLNPVEEAEGLVRMIGDFGLTQEQVSKSVGKSRPYITNSLRLLKLPEEVKDLLGQGIITAGHGRAILSVADTKSQIALAEKVAKDGLSVRVTETLASKKDTQQNARKKHAERDANLIHLEDELKTILGTKVRIQMGGRKGKIEIEYYNRDELERLIEMLREL